MVLDNQKGYVEIEQCRICGNKELISILSLGTQYLTGVFPDQAEDHLTHGPLELVKCSISNDRDHCGLVQLRQSYKLSEMYSENYGYRSSLNQSMAGHLKALVQELLTIVSVSAEDIILDIGSNDGTLLLFIRRRDHSWSEWTPLPRNLANTISLISDKLQTTFRRIDLRVCAEVARQK